jgi:hypothetical protein
MIELLCRYNIMPSWGFWVICKGGNSIIAGMFSALSIYLFKLLLKINTQINNMIDMTELLINIEVTAPCTRHKYNRIIWPY